jgi:hypothetical protein
MSRRTAVLIVALAALALPATASAHHHGPRWILVPTG